MMKPGSLLIKPFVLCMIGCLLFAAGNVMAAEPEVSAEPTPAAEPELEVSAEPDIPAVSRPFVVYNWGLSASWMTRIIKQTGRSNFVYEDFLPGLYFGMALTNVKYVTPTIRLAAYYPMVSTFNKFPQRPKLPLHYGVDFFGGPAFQISQLKYVRFNLTPGLHLMFLNSERWNYLNLGIGGLVGLELPLTRGWTILINGIASLDNGNLGGNRFMEPFDIAFQYQVDFGFRYSKKLPNTVSYIKPREKQIKPAATVETPVELEAEPEAEPEPEAEAEPEPEAEAEPEPEVEATPEPEAEPEVEPTPEPEAEPEAELEPGPGEEPYFWNFKR
jgi:hypothetical protein